MSTGWIGLGKLGAPMAGHLARHLAAAGHPLLALDRDPARIAAVPGAEAADLDRIAACQIVITSLPDDAALRAVALGPDGLIARMAEGSVLVETSTVSPETSAEIRGAAEARGVLSLAAPVSGSTATAEAAALTLFCSGPEAALERARPLLATFARTIHNVGTAEEARYLKLAINHFVGSTAQIAAEALTLARKGGVAWETMLAVLGSSVAASPLVAYKLDPLRRRDFTPAFSVAQMLKDMSLAVAAGEATGVAMPVAALVRDLYAAQGRTDLRDLDFFAALLAAERKAGLGEPDRPE
ncbi:NAD(P)-dependent oxidoreductase [Methylobacterium nonmethylotrophicum]|uniref:NAD(P)-dependent oxidoreductase n=1 Tax=Methylobacterium nonmethylotrophicum TaxID=1141884 RepID=A0A4Z0NUW7_9HYPH|nr:NAD(P)-dependent oxidoreductase [Methylobacterium nonmethylotrophicum]TGE01315.1 NAD(P)-dependent oxidoreductase [Methylobacterium nonmethylotrophicum]